MDTLSRREEDALLKATKAKALKECDAVVKAFAECAEGRTVTVAWACKDKYKDVQECMLQFSGGLAQPLSSRIAPVQDLWLQLVKSTCDYETNKQANNRHKPAS
ncbi:hypothetical protein BDY19DRAFT_988437 [Irpex rosettiformis]|uniref:Uncharacterized protein n=1 Tax=Irpex rosettiformis TaxID=378272 RepID=A0ACB8UK97_9APHY|nr:hypothetical protein BDY19DRAFT_988437 [Irpex rosettiformis]